MPVDPNALTDLPTVKGLLDIDLSDNAKDDILTILINGSSTAIESYCNRGFKKRSYVGEVYSSGGRRMVFLRQIPVVSIESISIINDDDTEDSITVKKKDLESGIIYHPDGRWPDGLLNLKVSYTAGYEPIPGDITLACSLLVEFYYKLSVADFSTVFGEGNVTIRPENFPGKVKALINPYKMVHV